MYVQAICTLPHTHLSKVAVAILVLYIQLIGDLCSKQFKQKSATFALMVIEAQIKVTFIQISSQK